MGAQINGLNQAARNANDGISAAQTTEGALNQINDNLQRIRVLTVQAANSTNSPEDRTSIQGEIGQRLDEIDRISRETEFNGVKVLASEQTLKIQVGANDGQSIEIDLSLINREALGLGTFNVDGSGAKANDVATKDSLVLAGFSEIETVGGSTKYERVTIQDNAKAGASDIVGRMATGDTVTVTGLNNGLGAATGDTYTYNASSNSFSFDVNDVSSSDVANFLKPAAGSKASATITLGGTSQDVLIDSNGNITNKDNQTLYIDTTGNLTLNGGSGPGALSAATLDSLAARMAAPATAVPTTTVTTPGANETNAVKFGDLAAGESVTVGGLTYTSGGGELAAAVAAKFAGYDASAPAAGFTGALAGWTNASAVTNGDEVVFTSTQTGDVTNLTPSAMGVFGGPVNAVDTRAAVDGTETKSTVTFAGLAQGDTATVNGITLTATDAGGMTAQEVADSFLAYFTSGTGGKGSFDPTGGDLADFDVVAGGANELVFTRKDAGVLSGVSVSGTGTGAAIASADVAGTDAVTARETVTFSALAAGEQFKITDSSGKQLTFTADAAMTGDQVASAFAAALADADALAADTRFAGDFVLSGNDGWTAISSATNTVTFESQYTGSDAATANKQLTSAARTAAAAQPSVPTVVAAAAEVTNVTFGALTAGQGVTVNGMTLTAKESMTAEAVALAFQQKSTNSYEGSSATFTGTFTAGFNIGTATGADLQITASVAGVSSGVTVSAPTAIGSGSISANGATFTVDGNSFDVTNASISASGLINEADGLAASLVIGGTGTSAGTYALDAAGEVTKAGAVQYIDAGTDELTDAEEGESTETYFAHSNGNVTDASGNRIYQDAAADSGFSTNATSPGDATENPLALLDEALATVDGLRSNLGAIQNRFQSAIQNLTTTSTNLAAAQSRIQDADYAVEVANMTRAQILQQAGTSVLAQANQIPQGVLSLLR